MRTDLTGLKFIIVAGAHIAASDLKDSLERRGAGVRVAYECAGAFEAIEQDKPSFAVIDWGHTDCAAVTNELSVLDIPYIYVSGPSAKDRDTVRANMTANIADAMLAIASNQDADELHA